MMNIFVRTAPRGTVKVNKTEEQIRETFKRADRDGDGRLNKEELKEAFSQLGAYCPDWRVFRSLHHVGANKDGYISITSFEFNALVKYAVSKYGYKLVRV